MHITLMPITSCQNKPKTRTTMKESLVIIMGILLWTTIVGTEIRMDFTNKTDYRYLSDYNYSIRDRNSLVFDMKGQNGLRILLLSQKKTFISPFYIIGLGRFLNKRSIIRNKDDQIVNDDYGPQLSAAYFRPFWISWKNGLIQAGNGSIVNSSVVLTFMDECLFAVNDIGIQGTTKPASFLLNTSITASSEISSLTTINTGNTVRYISYRCPSFQKISSSTDSSLIECCGICAHIWNCFAVSYSEITSECELYSNEAVSGTDVTYFIKGY